MNPILFFGAVFGLLAVGMGAYTDHVLSLVVDTKTLLMLKTALHYHLIHSVLLIAIGISLSCAIPPKLRNRLRLSAGLFIAGIVLFSFSIYLKGLTGMAEFIKMTPTGGMILILGWASLIWASLVKRDG